MKIAGSIAWKRQSVVPGLILKQNKVFLYISYTFSTEPKNEKNLKGCDKTLV